MPYVSDKGLTGTKLYKGWNFQKLLCSTIVFLEFNHNIICSYRAIGFISKNNPNIKFNRKIFGSLPKDWRKTWNNQINNYLIVINKEGFLLAQKGISTNFNNLFLDNDIIKPKYNKENFYEINIRYSFWTNETIANINQIETFKISDKLFKYSKMDL